MATGLSFRFTLKKGALSFTSGEQKVVDNLFFFMQFGKNSRIYLRDFTPDADWLLQKPISTITLLKGLFLGQLRTRIVKYIPEIVVKKLDVVYDRNNEPKKYGVEFSYKYQSNEQQLSQTVIFI